MSFDYAVKIQSLIANAENPGNSPEAQAMYRAKAEELMVKYRIAEEEALATDPGSAAPISHTIRVTTWRGYGNMLDTWYHDVFSAITRHVGVRYATSYDNDGTVATVVGYEGDVRYTEYLWTSALLMFSTRIDPVWDASLDETENIWRLRNAGVKRNDIADKAWGRGAGKLAANRSKVQRIYVRQCQLKGEPVRATGLGFQGDVYREAYARGFAQTLRDRMREARDAVATIGGLPELHGRSDRVDDAFYALFPQARPRPVDPNAPAYQPCPRCTANPSGTCKVHPYRWDTKAAQARYARQYESASANAGHDRGADAAREVHLARGGVDRQADMGARADLPELDG